MPSERLRRTFISYSRTNREFALELARELRSSGFNIWLDQLDIPTGARWDDEVERNLRECEIFMIILTPASTTSENVKDEIGYAIDQRKRILPVLLEECNIPLRLRRFQYVDFSKKSYEDGVESAKQLLRKLEKEPTEPIPAMLPETEEQVGSRSTFIKTKPVPAGSAQRKPSSKAIMIGIGIVVGIGVIAGIVLMANPGTSFLGGNGDGTHAAPTGLLAPATMAIQATNSPIPTKIVVQPTDTSEPTVIPAIATVIPETSTPVPQPFFIEEFDGDVSNWTHFLTRGNESQVKLHADNGRMIFEINGKDSSAYLVNKSFIYTDVQVEAVVLNRGVNDIKVSLICRYTDSGWYEVKIANTGLFEIYAVDTIGAVHKGFNRLYNGGSTKVKPGVDTNVYTLVCKGRELTFYVNGVKTQTFVDNDYKIPEGSVGIAVSSSFSLPVNVQFESLKISKP